MAAVDKNGGWIETAWDIANVVMDIGSLAVNIASGNVAGAALDAAGLVADVAATVIPGLPAGAGTAIKSVRAGKALGDAASTAVHAINIAEGAKSLSGFEKAAEFGVDSYKNLRTAVLSKYGKGSGLEVHHLVEKRLVKGMDIDPNQMKAIVLTKEEHQIFTARWRKEIPYGTENVSDDMIMDAAKKVYEDHLDILEILGL